MQLEQLDNVDSNVLIEEDQKSVSYESKKVHFEGNAINFFDKTNKKKKKRNINTPINQQQYEK